MLAKEITKIHSSFWRRTKKGFGSQSKSFKAEVMVNRVKLLWRIQVIGGRKCQWGLAIRKKDIAEWFQKMGDWGQTAVN